jgi:predicted aminopeptidase
MSKKLIIPLRPLLMSLALVKRRIKAEKEAGATSSLLGTKRKTPFLATPSKAALSIAAVGTATARAKVVVGELSVMAKRKKLEKMVQKSKTLQEQVQSADETKKRCRYKTTALEKTND